MPMNRKHARPQRARDRPTAKRVIPPGAASPAFRAVHGEDAVALVRQLDLSLPPSRIGLSRNGRWLAVAAASRRAGNLSLYDAADGSVASRATLAAPPARVFALDDGGCIAITQSGRVGAGTTDLHFVDASGKTRAVRRLDDKLTQAQLVEGAVIVGCRDGHLYSYDLTGALAWRYRVPPHAGLDPDDPRYRPCPYFLGAPFTGEHLLFSSWDRLFMLDRSGVRRWMWRTGTGPPRLRFGVSSPPPVASAAHYRLLGVDRSASADDVRRAFRKKAFATHPDRHGDDPRAAEKFKAAMRAYEAINAARRTGPEKRRFRLQISVVPGATLISALAVGDDGRAILSSRDGLTFIDTAGRVTKHLAAAAGVGTVHASGELSRIIYAQWHGLSFFTPDGLVKQHPTDRLYHVAARSDGRRVIAWSGRQALAFDEAGQLLAELEFAKPVSGVAFLAEDQLLISAGTLVWVALRPRGP